jgi:hypothetical protein
LRSLRRLAAKVLRGSGTCPTIPDLRQPY